MYPTVSRTGGQAVRDISVVTTKHDQTDAPHAGKITDNSDGTYLVSYSITVSATYSLVITFNSVLAAGSPHYLTVQAQTSDESLTYAYGNFRTVMTGKTRNIFVQTRDRFGNYISSDPAEFPDGSDEILLHEMFEMGNNP